MGEKVGVRSKTATKRSSIWTIFMHADRTDMLLMTLGFLGAVGDGLSLPLVFYIITKIMNNIGGGSIADPDLFRHNCNTVSLYPSVFLYI